MMIVCNTLEHTGYVVNPGSHMKIIMQPVVLKGKDNIAILFILKIQGHTDIAALGILYNMGRQNVLVCKTAGRDFCTLLPAKTQIDDIFISILIHIVLFLHTELFYGSQHTDMSGSTVPILIETDI